MSDHLYWISAVTYVIVLSIIHYNERIIKKKPNHEERAFRFMTMWIIFFCLQDAVWGLCEVKVFTSDSLFFFSSSVFHISTVLTTFFWLYYVLVYLGGRLHRRILFLMLDGAVILFELVLVVANFFTPTLFSIEDGQYVTGYLRPQTFMNQYVVYLLTGITVLLLSLQAKSTRNRTLRNRYRVVFIASLAPILLGVCQLLYPDGPFYSMGYFLACVILYVCVVAKDREEAEKGTIFKSISETYYSMHIIDLKAGTVSRYIEPDILKHLIGDTRNPQEMLNRVIRGTASEEYQDMVLQFVDLSTLSERLCDKKQISCEFVGRNYGWTRISFVSIEKFYGRLQKVMVSTQVIDTEKRAEIDMLFKTNNDELTGLYNRRAFDAQLTELDKRGLDDGLVLISMDLNGLKVANDTLGHAAGDELLTGAADCMKQCLSHYGKIFRVGGDEFYAILHATDSELEALKDKLDTTVRQWSGKLNKKLTLSCGYVAKSSLSDHATIDDGR